MQFFGKMKVLLPLVALLFLAGCGTSPIQVEDYSEKIVINSPELGVAVSVPLGESVVSRGVQSSQPALKLSEEVQFNKGEGESSLMTCALSVEPGLMFMRGSYNTAEVNAKCYGPANIRRTLADGTTNWNCPGSPVVVGDICRQDSGDIFLAIIASRVPLEQDFEHFEFTTSSSGGADNFVQELVYNGKSGTRIKFVYREFADSLTKPTYFQEFEADLAEGRVVTFKGVRLDIIEASSSALSFRVLSTFPDPEPS